MSLPVVVMRATVRMCCAPAINGVIRRCLERDPRQRFGDMQSVRLALSGVLSAGPASVAMSAALCVVMIVRPVMKVDPDGVWATGTGPGESRGGRPLLARHDSIRPAAVGTPVPTPLRPK